MKKLVILRRCLTSNISFLKTPISNPYREASCQDYQKNRGSMSIEAVVIIPLFVCFMVFILFIFRVLQVQIGMEEALRYTATTLSVTAYDSYNEEDKKCDGNALDYIGAQGLLLAKLDEYNCPTEYISGGVAGISLLGSEFDGEDIVLRASYDMRSPVGIFGDYRYHFIQCATARKWIGDGELAIGEDDQADNDWVYITPTGTVYHLTRECHYLDLSIREVEGSKVRFERNESGSKYQKCATCGKAAWNAIVYITNYGEAYHSSLTCSGLKRTIMMKRKSEAIKEGYGCCSKCSASQGG